MSVISVDDDSFEQEVLDAGRPVLVDFWAERCLPCVMLGDTLEELAAPLGSLVAIAKINVDENPVTPRRYGVRSLPTLMIFDGREVRASHVGSLSKSRLLEWVASKL
jgi:thioredoxin 1